MLAVLEGMISGFSMWAIRTLKYLLTLTGNLGVWRMERNCGERTAREAGLHVEIYRLIWWILCEISTSTCGCYCDPDNTSHIISIHDKCEQIASARRHGPPRGEGKVKSVGTSTLSREDSAREAMRLELCGTVSCCRRGFGASKRLREHSGGYGRVDKGGTTRCGIPGGVNGLGIEACTSYVAWQAVSP